MDRQLCFWELSYLNGKIFFSNNSFNGLFETDRNFDKVKFLGSFPDEDLDGINLHRKVFVYGNSLFFVPFFGSAISEYIPDEKIFKTYLIEGHVKNVSYSDSFRKNDCIYLLTSDNEKKFKVFDLKSRQFIAETEEINETDKLKGDLSEGRLSFDDYDVTYEGNTNKVKIIEKVTGKTQEKTVESAETDHIRGELTVKSLEKRISRCFYETEEANFFNLEDYLTFIEKRERTKRKSCGECGKMIWEWIKNNS